jgi:hypothetical protein
LALTILAAIRLSRECNSCNKQYENGSHRKNLFHVSLLFLEIVLEILLPCIHHLSFNVLLAYAGYTHERENGSQGRSKYFVGQKKGYFLCSGV